MANDGKLYITISKERGGGGETPEDKAKEKKSQANPLTDYAKHQFFNLVKETSTQAVNFGVSNIGNLTGNYITQRRVNEGLQVYSIGRNVAVSSIAGAKIGGVYGAILGAFFGAFSSFLNFGLQDLQGRIDTAKTNYNIRKLQERAGLNENTNGGR